MDDGPHISIGNFRPRCLSCRSESLKIDGEHGLVECSSCHRTILARTMEPILVDFSIADYLRFRAEEPVSVNDLFELDKLLSPEEVNFFNVT